MKNFAQFEALTNIENIRLVALRRWFNKTSPNQGEEAIFYEDLVELVLLSIEYKKNYGKDVLPKLIRERDLNELGMTIRREGTFLTIKDSEELREGLIVYRRESRVMFRERKYLIIMENGETILIQEKV
jgi:hypothetical protein